jgi:hypothetical protein
MMRAHGRALYGCWETNTEKLLLKLGEKIDQNARITTFYAKECFMALETLTKRFFL